MLKGAEPGADLGHVGFRQGVVFAVVSVVVVAAWVQPAGAGRRPAPMGMDRPPTSPTSAVPLRTPSGMVPGIDVSHWQDAINWSRVAGSGIRFAVMKATDGQHYIDPTFSSNTRQATANGIAVGAYHFANASRNLNDAVAEADHFVAVTNPSVGDLVPALDIEQTNGLSVTQLRAWVKAWLAEVVKRTGVHPMIYTSPYFWQSALGDWQWFSANGYHVLWIAHWRVQAPTVPAADWSGHGWTYWQWTDCVSIPGIANCVDGDRFKGADLEAGEIARVQVSTTPGGVVTSDTGHLACSGTDGTCSALTDPGVTLTLRGDPDPDAVLVGWTGACAGQGAVCSLTSTGRVTTKAMFGYPVTVTRSGTGGGSVVAPGDGIDCGTTCSAVANSGSRLTLTATPDSASGFGGWAGACEGTASSCTIDVTAPTEVTARFDASVSIAADGAGTRFAWGRVAADGALGGSYLVENRPDASVSFAFTGGRVTWYSANGPKGGIASVAVDGSAVASTSTYSSSPRFGVGHELGGLAPGSHVLTITVSGSHAPRSTGLRLGVDGLKRGGTLYKSPSPLAARWATAHGVPGAESTLISDTPGAAAWLTFHGTGVTLDTLVGPDMGRAAVSIDGRLVRTFDLSSTSVATATRSITGLSDASHTIRILATGEHGHRGRGTSVAVAGWTVS
ncbi:MAG: GH25 family lysozyme [Actinomycetota bacterium]